MDAAEFSELVGLWLHDVREAAILLHKTGVLAEHCLPIASQIADAKAAKRVLDRQRMIIDALPGEVKL